MKKEDIQKITKLNNKIKNLTTENKKLEVSLVYANQSISNLQNDIDRILNTKGWKELEKIRRKINKLKSIKNKVSSLIGLKKNIFLRGKVPINKQDIKFCIGIPSYNHSSYIEQCINSCLNQTYKNFEIIITDDNSTDIKTIKILKKFEKKYPKIIKCVYHTNNRGISNSINEQILLSQSQYFAMLDCDDYLEPNALEIAFRKIKKDNNPDYIFTDRKHVDQDNNLLTIIEYGGYKKLLEKGLKIEDILPIGMAASHLKIIKTEFFSKVGLCSNYFSIPGKAGCQDYDFALRSILENCRFSYIDKALYNHRQHLTSVTTSSHTQQVMLSDQVKNLFFLRRYLNNVKKIYPKKHNQKTHILYIVPYLVTGGAEKWLINLIKFLKERNFIISIITTNGGGEWENKFREISDYLIINDCQTTQKDQIIGIIESHIINYGVDIVHISNSEIGYDAIPNIYNLYPKPKIIDTIHSDKSGFINYSSKYISYLDARTTVNLFTKNYLSRENLTITEKTHSIINGVPIELNNYKNKSNKENTVLFVGRLSEEKNVNLFIEIANTLSVEYPTYNFLVIGEGPDFKDVSSKKHSDRIKFLGKKEDVDSYYQKAKFIFITSKTEGLPLVLCEAMSYGCIPISTPVGGIPEIIKNGENGFLCSNKNDFIQAFSKIEKDGNLIKILSSNCISTVKNKLSINKFGKSYIDIYNSLKLDNSITSPNSKLISICILTLNRYKALDNLLRSIKKYTKLPHEILILDQNSDTETKEYLKNINEDNIKVFYSEKNLGCSGGRKYLIQKTNGDYVVQLDNDLEVKSNWLEKLLASIEWDKEIGGACGRVTFPNGKTEYNGADYSIDKNFITYTLSGNEEQSNNNDLLVENYSRWLPGGATIFKKSVFDDENYDDKFLNGFEDNDLSFRLEKHGWKFVNCPSCIFIHNHRMFLSNEDLKKDERYIKQRNDFSRIKESFLRFYEKHKLIINNQELWKLINIKIKNGKIVEN